MTIDRLDEDTVRKIAAGEVIERPASVVKELFENSLDAGATRIDVAVEAAGTERIRVADDGVGMSREAVRLAVEEHTTSKIGDIDDLESGIATLGFRGEAVHAIGAVSKTTITTRPEGGDRATELVLDHGEVTSIEPAGRPEGTTVDVTELFAETPARRKFLKTESTEFDHVNRIVTRYALANPAVAVSLTHGDREVFATTGQDDLEAAILAVYGREVAESMIEVEYDAPKDTPIDRVSGYVSHPETTRSTREYVSPFVNDRFVPASMLRRAVVDAYGGQLAAGRYPFAVVFLELPADGVDVNVHPRKLEVRFSDESAVSDAVSQAVESALLDHGLIRSSAPRGRSAPDDVELPREQEGSAASDADGGDGGAIDAGPSEAPTTSGNAPAAASSPSDPERGSSVATDSSSAESTAVGESLHSSAATDDRSPDQESPHRDTARVRDSGTQERLDAGVQMEASEFDRLPDMRLLGQLQETYVLAETANGLLLVDQHAADERINYERLEDSLESPAVQSLAEPVEVELTAREAEALPRYLDALEALGFRAEGTGDRTATVSAVPAILAEALEPDRLPDVLAELLANRRETSVDARTDDLLSDLACHPSITGHTSLTEGSIRALLSELDSCDNPYACPHGRPVLLEIDHDEIEDRFERDYPGHGEH